MNSLRLTPLLLCLALTLPCTAGAQEAESKAVGKIYTAVEALLKDSTHCHWEIAHMEEEFTHKCDAWFSHEGHPLKVTDDIEGLDERRLTEYVFDGPNLVFVLQRVEHTAGESVSVHEDRLYYAKGRLFYHLAKDGKFKTGAKLDVSAVKSTPQPLPAKDDSFALRAKEAKQIATALQTGPMAESGGSAPQSEPAAGGKEESADTALPAGPAKQYCTLIADSASPDGRYALGWGLTDSAKGPVASKQDAEQDTEGVKNYIVDTKTGTIIAVTSGAHFGSKAAYNHWEHAAVWSPDSTLVIQTVNMKWATLTGDAFRVADGKATRLTDFLADVRTAVEAKLDKSGGAAWKDNRDSFTFTIAELKIAKDGTVSLNSYHQIPKGEEVFTFKVTGKFSDSGKFAAAKIEKVKE